MYPFPSGKLKILCLLSWCFILIFCSQAFALDPDIVKVRNAIKEAVGKSSSNIEIGIFGSHADGKNFISPLKGGSSDFDMRLIFKNVSPDDADALRQWKAFRERLREALAKQYPDEGDLLKIMDKTNVYPPEELMKGVTGRQGALNRFKQMNVSPKLTQHSAQGMTEETFKELGGGLYGETTEKATRQAFETKVGKVIGKDASGKVREFLSDITHQAEGRGFYTVKGSGNAASQWIDDALDALKKGNPKGIAKNVERAGILLKGKDLARAPLKESDIALKNAAKEMEAILKEFGDDALDGAALQEFEKRVSSVVSKYGLEDLLKICKADAELLKLFGNPKFEGQVAKGLLWGVGKWGKLRNTLSTLWSKVPEGTTPAVLNVLILTFQAPEQYEKEGALKAALESAIGLATLHQAFGPIGWAQLAATITVSILDVVTDYLKDRIYEFAAGSQSCSDLIAGRYTVKGREAQVVDPILEAKCHEVQEIEELACYTKDEAVVLRLIECHAKNAAKRFQSGGAGEKETEEGIVNALMRKCGRDGSKAGIVLQDWMQAREGFQGALDNFARVFDGSPLNIEARPDPAEIGEKGAAAVRLEAYIPNFSEEGAKEALQCLGGQGTRPYVYTRYKWGVNGLLREETTLPFVDLEFDKPGDYTIDLAVEVEYSSSDPYIQTRSLSKGGRFILTVHKKDKPQDDKKDGKPGDGDKSSSDDKTGGQKQPPQVQPEDYTKGQIGITGGTGPTGGQAGTTGPTGQTGITTTTQTTGTLGTTQGTGSATGGTQGTTGTTGVSTGTGTGKDTTSGVGTTGVGTDVGKTATTTKEPPACTYEYSAWGDCNRATKKWTRTVTAKKPAGCVEKGKPDLEGDCTPPPTAEEKRLAYLNCLCMSAGGSLGGYYGGPDGKPCTTYGPLTGWGAPLPRDPKVIKYCLGSYLGHDATQADIDKATKDIKQENKKFQTPLKLTLTPDKCPVEAQLGDIITFTAGVEGGAPSNTVSWSGDGEAKDRTFTFANSRKPGVHPVSVTVTDEDGTTVTKTCSVRVNAFTVILKVSPAKQKYLIGSTVTLSAEVKSGDAPARGSFVFRWQPHPEVDFGDNFETTGSSASGKLTKIGPVKFWVNLLQKEGDVLRTVGESNQIEAEVVKPEFKLAIAPESPLVGQEVKATVSAPPELDAATIDFWWEYKGNALNPGPLRDNREYTFRLKDTKPVTVTVHGKAKDGGDDLGEASATVTAQAYEVSIGEPQRRGPKPKIWNPQVWKSPEWKQGSGLQGEGGLTPGGGLVEVADNQFAVFEDIFVKADVKPTPEKLPLRYDWAIAPSGICGIPGAGQELRLNCSQTGTYTVNLSARDSENVVLGTASRAVGVTVSQDDLDKAKKPRVTLQADKTTMKTGETAAIKAAVQGGKAPYTYRWGDGIEGKGETLNFAPKKSGSHKITVEVTDGAGNKASATLTIKVERAKLEVTLKAAKTEAKLGETIEIKAEAKGGEAPLTYAWGPGLTGKGDSVPFVAKKGGAQTVFVEVTDKARQKAKASVEIKVEVPKLEVSLKADKTTLKTGETALIQAIVKGGVPPVTNKWSAGVDAKGEAASFTPKKSGSYKITLDVTDSAKQTVNATVDLKVEAPKLEVSLKADKTTLKLGETAALQAVIKGGEAPFITRWGSGTEGKGETARFVADKPGTQKASVDVSDQAGQKATASLDLKVEVPKLEVALTADKPVLKVGEKGTIQAKVKGGMPDYTYQWSSFVSGKGETAAFTPSKTGIYKVWLEVRDKMGTKTTAGLDWKVEAEVVSSSKTTSPTTPATTTPTVATPPTVPADGKSTSATTTIPTTTGKGTTSPPPVSSSPVLVMEPASLKIPQGGSAALRIFTKEASGKRTDVTNQSTLTVSPGSGIKIDRSGRITAEKTAVPGAIEPILATLKQASGQTLRADGIIRIEGDGKLSSGSGYDPNTDPGRNLTKVKSEDLEKVKKIGDDFQKGQWTILDDRTQKIKDQKPGQTQSPEYLGTSTTSETTTGSTGNTGTSGSTGSTTTSDPTTKSSSGTTKADDSSGKKVTTSTGGTSKDLTDVTVGRRDVTITVWDHSNEDGDIINIYLNGKILKNKLRLTNKKQSFRVNLSGGQNRFEVEAVNEGSQSPNTATVEISNVTKGKPSQVYERKSGQKTSMNLNAP